MSRLSPVQMVRSAKLVIDLIPRGITQLAILSSGLIFGSAIVSGSARNNHAMMSFRLRNALVVNHQTPLAISEHATDKKAV